MPRHDHDHDHDHDHTFPLPFALLIVGYSLILVIDKVLFDPHKMMGEHGHGHGHEYSDGTKAGRASVTGSFSKVGQKIQEGQPVT